MSTLNTYRSPRPSGDVAQPAWRARLALRRRVRIRELCRRSCTLVPAALPRVLVVHVGAVDVVFHPAGLLLFAAIAGACDIAGIPAVDRGTPVLVSHLVAVAIALLLLATTLLHEAGHALAYRVQGGQSICIAVRGSGGACTATVPHDSPIRALLRALAGPAATVAGLAFILIVRDTVPLPPVWRTAAVVAARFALLIEIANILPAHPHSDGMLAVWALLWLLYRHEPDRFIALYVWRPVVLALIVTIGVAGALALGYLPPGTRGLAGPAVIIVALYASPALALVGRYLHRYPHRRDGARNGDCATDIM